jgi:hypothetical protein
MEMYQQYSLILDYHTQQVREKEPLQVKLAREYDEEMQQILRLD